MPRARNSRADGTPGDTSSSALHLGLNSPRQLMHRTRLIPLAALLAACASAGPIATGPGAGEPRTHAPQPTTGAITPADLMTRLYIFADDSMLGRESGTLGNVIGTNYVAREMARMGLEPGGESQSWFQTVPIRIARVDTTRPLTVNGAPL